MSLVVHKLVLSPGGASSSTQQPTHHVTLSAYTHSRSNVSDAMGRALDGPPSGPMSATPSSSSSSLYASSSSSKHAYNLPFVLQDHNYGAPPPPTPPQSPPPLPSSSGASLHHHRPGHVHGPQQKARHPQQGVPPGPAVGGPPPAVPGLLTSHPLHAMPPHRQQFMPHPKGGMFPSPHIPPPPLEPSQSPGGATGGAETDDDSRLSDRSSSVGPSGEETETAPEGEGDEQPVDDSITRCVCDFSHDDGYMIQCDRCFVWQHVDCMEIDRDNIPDEYLCEACDPRPIDRLKARALQSHRRQEIKAHLARLSSSDSDDNVPMSSKGRGNLGKVQERKVVKKKKVKQIKDMKNGRKGSVSLLKKSSVVTPCNNNVIPGAEDKERRMIVKRRRKSSSMSGGEGVSDDSSGGPVERLRAWVEGYEVAVTNHYSPELRARVHAARINGVSPDLRASTQGAVLGHRCRVVENLHPLFDVFDSKILVAATRLSMNTAITEFQGKYLLASQWNAQQPAIGQPYLPYVLQYHMPKEGLTVCVDARTYGNDARFTRRSCRPNAEVRHVVERGSLHLYLVATRDIEEGEEVTLSLETANSTLELVCCLAEEHECQAPSKAEQTSPVPIPPHKKNGLILSNKKPIKKQQLQLQLRTSKRTASSENRSADPVISPCASNAPVTPVKQRRASGCGKSPAKSPSVSSSPEDSGRDSTLGTPPAAAAPEAARVVDKQQQQKMTREERKIAAYMKAFERMEKAAQRRQEMEKKKEEDRGKDPKDKDKKRDADEEDWEKTSSADEGVRSVSERCKRKGKKGRGKGSPQKRNNHRVDSTASDLTGDESSCASVGLMSPVGGSNEGIALSISSPPQGNSNAMGFRFPKTKKALMNEWLNENVDPVHPGANPNGAPELHAGVPTCYMRSPATPLRRSSLNQGVVQGAFLNLDNMSGGSAKKRWLRQAISEETESPQLNGLCPSPNSRPDSPTGGGDYITPLKKRRLARESMSSELSSTPPSTPVHSTSLEEDKMTEEMEEAELDDEAKGKPEDAFSEDRPYLLVRGGRQDVGPSARDDVDAPEDLEGDSEGASEEDEEDHGAIASEGTIPTGECERASKRERRRGAKSELEQGAARRNRRQLARTCPNENKNEEGKRKRDPRLVKGERWEGEEDEEEEEEEGEREVINNAGEEEGKDAISQKVKEEVNVKVEPEEQGVKEELDEREVKMGIDAQEIKKEVKGENYVLVTKKEMGEELEIGTRDTGVKEEEAGEGGRCEGGDGGPVEDGVETKREEEEREAKEEEEAKEHEPRAEPSEADENVEDGDRDVAKTGCDREGGVDEGDWPTKTEEPKVERSQRYSSRRRMRRNGKEEKQVTTRGNKNKNLKNKETVQRRGEGGRRDKGETKDDNEEEEESRSQGKKEEEDIQAWKRGDECRDVERPQAKREECEVGSREDPQPGGGHVGSETDPTPDAPRPETREDPERVGPRTPDGPHSPGVRGPRTPEGPAPVSPDDPGSPAPSADSRRASPDAGGTPDFEPRARGPCTPPSPPPTEQDERDEAENQDDETLCAQQQPKPAPAKRKLSILEYRKRKSVGSECAPNDVSSPPPPPPSSSNARESSSCLSPLSSPSRTSPDEGDESPDLALSPIQPFLLPHLSAVFDAPNRNEGKRDADGAEADGTDDGGAANAASSGVVPSSPLSPIAGTPQDVKWNAAPTLLERQRENLTARLKREFGLCLSDDDEAGHAAAEGEERTHRRLKDKNLPPPPPPSSAPPKNSIFQGREVTIQKVGCSKGVAPQAGASGVAGSQQRLATFPRSSVTAIALAGTYLGPPPPPPLPPPPTAPAASASAAASTPGAASISVQASKAPAPPAPLSIPVVIQSKSSPADAPRTPPASQTPPYPPRPYPRGVASPAVSLYSPNRALPPPPQNPGAVPTHPAPVRPQEPPPTQGPPGLASPGLGYGGGGGGGGYSGHDCSGPGSRGS